MVAGGTFPASTVLLTVNPKRATDAGCSMTDRQKAGDYKSRASASLEGEGKAGTRHWIALRPSRFGFPASAAPGLVLSQGFSSLGLKTAVAMQKGERRGEDSERTDG